MIADMWLRWAEHKSGLNYESFQTQRNFKPKFATMNRRKGIQNNNKTII